MNEPTGHSSTAASWADMGKNKWQTGQQGLPSQNSSQRQEWSFISIPAPRKVIRQLFNYEQAATTKWSRELTRGHWIWVTSIKQKCYGIVNILLRWKWLRTSFPGKLLWGGKRWIEKAWLQHMIFWEGEKRYNTIQRKDTIQGHMVNMKIEQGYL